MTTAADFGAHEKELYSGKDIRTTIDLGWQGLADSLLWFGVKDIKGFEQACLVVMDVRDGGLPAIVNLSHKSDIGYGLGNWAMELGYEPGPVMEPLIWMVALKDGMFRSKETMAEAFTSGKMTKTYKVTPEHFVNSLIECLPPEEYIWKDIHGASNVKIHSPKSKDWSESDVEELAKGWVMKVTATHIAAFYSTLATGVRTLPYLVKKSHDKEPRILGDERNLITGLLDDYGTAGLVGKNSMSRWNGYAAETFAGIFPKEKPRFAIVCAIFTDRPYSGYRMTGTVGKVAGELSESIIAGMIREEFPGWRNTPD